MKPANVLILLISTLLPGMLAANTQRQNLSHYERKIVASCLILEAASDGEEGMRAVLNVIFNRADRQPQKVVQEVVKPKQFTSLNSVTGQRNPNFSPIIRRALKDPLFNEAYQLVLKMEQGELIDNTRGADHYHVSQVESNPYWAETMKPTTTVGSHIFYTSKSSPLSDQAVVAAIDFEEEQLTR